jgi:hypothetical protein
MASDGPYLEFSFAESYFEHEFEDYCGLLRDFTCWTKPRGHSCPEERPQWTPTTIETSSNNILGKLDEGFSYERGFTDKWGSIADGSFARQYICGQIDDGFSWLQDDSGDYFECLLSTSGTGINGR